MIPSAARISLSVFGLCAVCQAGETRLGGVDFARQSVAAGRGPAAVAAGDVDGDGHPDLVVANQLGGDISILLGDGEGGFTARKRVAAGENPSDLALADLDVDGDLDVVVANHETQYLTILLGDGKGAFRAAANSPLRIAVSPHPHAIRAVDLDRDGHLDVVVDHRHGEGLLILRGLGGGTFEFPGKLVDTGGDPYRGMAIGDLDGDGQFDLVTPNPRKVGVVLARDARRLEYAPPRTVRVARPFAVALGDLSGDGVLDLVAASEYSRDVHVLLGDGQGGFRNAEGSPLAMTTGAKNIALGDFNGDGIADAAVASFTSPQVLLFLGGRDRPGRQASWPGGENPWGLAATDLNGDGKHDLVITDYANPRLTAYISQR